MGRFAPERKPVPSTFYRLEIGKLSRPSRGWAKGNCVFHESRSRSSFSVNLDSGAFHCFGCGAHGGDVITFVRLRYKLNFQQAAELLGAWDGEATSMSRSELHRQRRERARMQLEAAERVETERLRRIEATDWLRTLERSYSFASDRLTELRRGSLERYVGESEDCWGILSAALPQIRVAESEAGFGK